MKEELIKEKIVNRLIKAITDKVFPGCVVGIVKTTGERYIYPVGNVTYENNSRPTTLDTIYDLASVTKSIPGSSSLLKLLDEQKINLEDRIVDFIPEFGNYENKKEARIKHILTYSLDLEISSLSALKDRSPDEILNAVFTSPLKNPPGTTYKYTNATANFINPIIEKVTGKSLDVFAYENFFKPLHMNRTTFHPEHFPKDEFAPTEIDEWRGRVIQGEVHDESTYVIRKKYMTAAAGLFSTAPDILNFLEMLLCKGVKDGRRYFSEEILHEMHTNQLGDSGNETGLGWVMNWPEATGMLCSKETFCKSGFTGTLVVIDPIKNVAFVVLSNRTYPQRPKDTTGINEVRRDIADIIFGAL